MNNSQILNVLLAVALVILSIKLAFFSSPATDEKASGKAEKTAVADTSPSSPSAKNETSDGTWRRIDPTELQDNPFQLFGNWMALSVGREDKMNSMTIGWGAMGLLWENRPAVTVYVRETHYTRELMDANEYFTVTAFGPEQKKTLMYLGTVSGRKEDKMKGSGLTTRFTELGNPYFDEGRLVIECKKQYGALFDKQGFGELPAKDYSTRPVHEVYVGEIINVWIKE